MLAVGILCVLSGKQVIHKNGVWRIYPRTTTPTPKKEEYESIHRTNSKASLWCRNTFLMDTRKPNRHAMPIARMLGHRATQGCSWEPGSKPKSNTYPWSYRSQENRGGFSFQDPSLGFYLPSTNCVRMEKPNPSSAQLKHNIRTKVTAKILPGLGWLPHLCRRGYPTSTFPEGCPGLNMDSRDPRVLWALCHFWAHHESPKLKTKKKRKCNLQ